MTNTERALLGSPLRVLVTQCCKGNRDCDKISLGRIGVIVNRFNLDIGKKYTIRTDNQLEYQAWKIRVLK